MLLTGQAMQNQSGTADASAAAAAAAAAVATMTAAPVARPDMYSSPCTRSDGPRYWTSCIPHQRGTGSMRTLLIVVCTQGVLQLSRGEPESRTPLTSCLIIKVVSVHAIHSQHNMGVGSIYSAGAPCFALYSFSIASQRHDTLRVGHPEAR